MRGRRDLAGLLRNRPIAAGARRLAVRAGEHQYASEGVWGALRYASWALKGRYGAVAGNLTLEKGYLPGQANGRDEVNARMRRWASAERLHRHFYNSNLTGVQLAERRNSATLLLDEAFGALEV